MLKEKILKNVGYVITREDEFELIFTKIDDLLSYFELRYSYK